MLNTKCILRSFKNEKSVRAQTHTKNNVYSQFLKRANPNKARLLQCVLLESVNFKHDNRDFNERCNFLISHYDYSLDYIPLASFRRKSSW